MNQSEWKQKLKDFSILQKKEILDDIHQIVRDGIYGKDYTVAPREKNKRLRTDYCVNDTKIREILMSLKIEDFVRIDDTNNQEYPGDIVYKFSKEYPLMKRWEEDADYEDVPLYIKMVKPEVGGALFIISIHEEGI